MRQPAPPPTMSPSERAILEAMADSKEIPDRVKNRAQAVILAADGMGNSEIAREVSMARARVLEWRKRFAATGIRGLWDPERIPPREPVPKDIEQAIVFECLYRPIFDAKLLWEKLEAGDYRLEWRTRGLVKRYPISRSTVQRIWGKHGIRLDRERHVNFGADISRLIISDDPLFGLSAYRVALFYHTLFPVLVVFTRERPFSQLRLSPLSQEARHEVIDSLLTRLRRVDSEGTSQICRSATLGKLADRDLQRYRAFQQRLLDKPRHRGAHIHLIFAWRPWDSFREHAAAEAPVLTSERWYHQHFGPYTQREQPWCRYVERWLNVIAQWPMQKSLVTSIYRLYERLRKIPTGKSVGPFAIY